jgi:hypothetical protein
MGGANRQLTGHLLVLLLRALSNKIKFILPMINLSISINRGALIQLSRVYCFLI